VKIEGHKREIMDCAFAQNDHLLITISSGFGMPDDYSLRVFDVSSGEMQSKITLKDHYSRLCVSMDGTYALILQRDDTWSAFNLQNGNCLWETKFKNSELEFAQDGRLYLHKGDLKVSLLDINSCDIIEEKKIELTDHLCLAKIGSGCFCFINKDKGDKFILDEKKIIKDGYRWWLMPDGSSIITIRVDLWGGITDPLALNAVLGPDGGAIFEPSVESVFVSDDRKSIVATRETTHWSYKKNQGYDYKSRHLYKIDPFITAIADLT